MYFNNIILFQFFAIVISWFLAQLIKSFLGQTKFFKKGFFSTTGGMPSAHTSSASTFFFLQLLFFGFDSIALLSLMFLVVIMVDARGVRYATGINASILKKIIPDKKINSKIILKEGHTKLEIFVGLIVGLLVSVMTFFIFLGVVA